MAAGHIAREIMCSVLVRERPGGVGHCLATTRDENGCVRVSASAVEDLDDLELPRDPYKYKAKQPDPLRRGFRFSACNSKKTYCLFREKPPSGSTIADRASKCSPTQVLVVQSRHEFRSTLLAQSLVRSRARRVVHTALRHSGTTLQLASCASADGRAVHVIEDWRRLLLL